MSTPPYDPSNPYEELVKKATGEDLPSEDWQTNLELSDRVTSAGAPAARQVLELVTARLQHPSANVQLYALTLADVLGKNVPNAIMFPEMSDPALCAQLARMVHDTANVSAPVRSKLLGLMKEWDADLTSAGLSGTTLQETYASLKSENLDIAAAEPAAATDAEDEELKRVLAISLQDRGGRSQWTYDPAFGAGAGGSSGSAAPMAPSDLSAGPPSHTPSSTNNPFLHQGPAVHTASSTPSAESQHLPQVQLIDDSPAGASGPPGGNMAAAAAAAAALGASAPLTATAPHRAQEHTQESASSSSSGTWDTHGAGGAGAAAAGADSARAVPAGGVSGPMSTTNLAATSGTTASAGEGTIVSSRVRALYDFSSTEPGELNFQAGDIIRVLDTVYEHWWRGEVRGTVGIFPVNHVEILPNPTPDDLVREATAEATLLASATAIDAFSAKLATLDPAAPVPPNDKAELDRLHAEASAIIPDVRRTIDRLTARLAEFRGLSDKYDQAQPQYTRFTEGGVGGRGGDPPAAGAAGAPTGTAPTTSGPASAYGTNQAQAQAPVQANPQPPPGMDPASPEYAEWYYRMYPQMAPQQ